MNPEFRSYIYIFLYIYTYEYNKNIQNVMQGLFLCGV